MSNLLRTPLPKNTRRVLILFGLAIGVWLLFRGILGIIVPPVSGHPAQERRMTVAAHRGGSALSPENTLQAFRTSAGLGVDILEMDVHLSADKQLVVIHDETVDRTTNGEGRVEDLTLTELQMLDAGYWWPHNRRLHPDAAADFPAEDFRYRGQGITIPSLEAVLSEFPDTMKIIEIKPRGGDIITALGNILREYHQEEHAVVGSFHSEAMQQFRRQFPEFATSAAHSEVRTLVTLNFLGFGSAYASPAEFLHVPVSSGSLTVITDSFLQTARDNNIRVHAWTINQREEMQRLLDMGVDGIITDNPAELLDLLQR